MGSMQPGRLLAQGVILHLCFPIMFGVTMVGATSLDFLRKVVAPVVVPSNDRRGSSTQKRQTIRKLTREELKEERQKQKERRKQRRAREQESRERRKLQQTENTEQLIGGTSENQQQQRPPLKKRNLGWFGNSGSKIEYSETFLVDPSQEYDKWAQAYRFLGGYIDCDHPWQVDEHNSHEDENRNRKNQDACSRWMIYATVRCVAVAFPLYIQSP